MQTSFVDVGGLTLHVRGAGAGPVLVLLHQAPTSARTLESRIDRLSGEFLCIAPDLPGLGKSDALGGGLVTVERMAGVLIGLLDTLGVDRATLYGQHTGALVATEIAVREPARIAAVVVGGYPIYTPEECAQRLATYAPELPAPSWDGAHLAWLWWRYREQFLYWPWNTKEPRARATMALPSTAYLQQGVAEIAACHASYAAVYHAAFDYDAEGTLQRIEVPVHFVLDAADSLSLKIELAAAANPALHRWPGVTEEIEAIEARLFREIAIGQPTGNGDALGVMRSPHRRLVEWDGGAVEVTVICGTDPGAAAGSGGGAASRKPPCILLPPFPASPRAVIGDTSGKVDRPLVLVDPVRLPVEGSRGAWADGFAEAVAKVVSEVSEEPFDVIAAGGAATLAAILRDAPRPKLRRVVLLDPDDRGDGTPFDATLCLSGGHLLRLWDRLRFERLKTPVITPRDRAAVRGRYENLDLLGRYGWDAVSRLAEIPAWDHLVAAGADCEAALLSDERTRIVVTGIDRRGRVERHADAAGGVTLVAGTTSDPFREALAILDQTAA